MGVFILIASHIGSQIRAKLVPETLLSIKESMFIDCHILVSYSVEEGISDPYIGVPYISAYKQPTRLAQFEHYQYLSAYISPTDTVMFSDDDDLYGPKKVSKVLDAFSKHSHAQIVLHDAMCFGMFDEHLASYKQVMSGQVKSHIFQAVEYFQYSVRGKVIIDFFKSNYWNPELHTPYTRGYQDIFFRMYLDKVSIESPVVHLPNHLVYKRESRYPRDWLNFKSICG